MAKWVPRIGLSVIYICKLLKSVFFNIRSIDDFDRLKSHHYELHTATICSRIPDQFIIVSKLKLRSNAVLC